MLPRLYAIVDASCFVAPEALFDYVRCLLASGVMLIQYRDKAGPRRDILSRAREIFRLNLANSSERVCDPATLILNDYADLAVAAVFDGVHLGQDDLSVENAREFVGEDMLVGISTHNPEQVAAANNLDVNYIAVGPVFATASKANPDPVIGLEGVRRARELTSKPLVAIGGITRANAESVIQAGAWSVAVISDLLSSPARACEEFLKMLG
jgi:thiamine-phosphate pyrophosphorylase